MKAVLMAGGEGSRLRPLTILRPKPMVPIVDKTVMEHVLDLLQAARVNEVVVTVPVSCAHSIQDYFGDGLASRDEEPTTSVEEVPARHPRVGEGRPSTSWDQPFVVISGDALTDLNLQEIVGFHPSTPRPDETLILLLPRDQTPWSTASSSWTRREGRSTQFLKKTELG